jgi:predicted metal-dependent peptidase
MGVANTKMQIYYNPSFVEGLDKETLQGVLMHELSHSILRHFERRGKRNPLLWNISTDGVINEDLLSKDWKLPEGVVKGQFFRGKSAEQVYDELAMKNHSDDENNENDNGRNGKGEGKGEDTQNQNDQDGNQNGKILDDHDFNYKENESGEGKGKGEEKSEDAEENVKEAIRKAIREAKADKEKEKGVVYGGKEYGLSGKEPTKVIEQVFEVFFVRRFRKFEDYMKHEIYESLGDEQNWLFPHIISTSVGEYLPSLNDRKKKVIIIIDTSGSIENWKAEQFVSLVNRIVRRRSDVEGRVIQCDDAVLSDEPIKTNFKKMTIRRGNGGTSFLEAINYIQKKYKDAKIVLYFTDGRGEMPLKKPPFRLLWVMNEQDADEYIVSMLNKYGKVLTYSR